MPDLFRIKQNVSKMVSAGAPEQEIDQYISMEGTTANAIKNVQINPKPSLYSEVGAPFAHALSLIAGDVPKAIGSRDVSPEGQEAYRTLYPEQQTGLGKALRLATNIPAFAFGIPGKAALATGKILTAGAGQAAKYTPRFFGKSLAGRTALRAGEFGASQAAIAPKEGEDYAKQVGTAAAFGAGTPAAGLLAKSIGKSAVGSGTFVAKTFGGVTDFSRETIKRLGSVRVFDPVKQSAGYIGEVVVPKVKNIISQKIADGKDRITLRNIGVNDEQISWLSQLSPIYKDKLSKVLNGENVNIKQGIEAIKGDAHKRFSALMSRVNPNTAIDVKTFYNNLKNTLVKQGWVDRAGQESVKYGRNPVRDQLLSIYNNLTGAIKTETGGYRKYVLNIPEYENVRNALTTAVSGNPQNDRLLFELGGKLRESAANTIKGLTGVNKLYSDAERLAEIEGKGLFSKILNPEKMEAEIAKLRNIDKPNQIARIKSVIGKNLADDVDAHLAVTDLGLVTQRPGVSGGMFPGPSGVKRALLSGATQKYYRDIYPKTQKMKGLYEALRSGGENIYKKPLFSKPLLLNRANKDILLKQVGSEKGSAYIGGEPPRQSPQGKPLTAAEAVKQGMAKGAQGQNPLRNKSGQAFIGSGQEVSHPSRIYKILAQNPQEIWSPQQLRGFLSGKVSRNEMDTLLTSELMAKPKITKTDILQSIEKNMPQVEVVRKGSNLPSRTAEEWQSLIKDAERRNDWNETDRLTRQWESAEGYAPSIEEQPQTKFQQYQLPGGSNYQETLIKAPTEKQILLKWEALKEIERRRIVGEISNEEADKLAKEVYRNSRISEPTSLEKNTFKSPHFDESNVLAHVRHNDRVTPQGEKIRFLEEIQSDWATQGRREGYKQNLTSDEQWQLDNLRQRGIPFHPLLKNWQELTLKQALKDAVESDAKYLSWTTGEQQAGRYNLAKQVDTISWRESPDGTKAIYIKPKDTPVISVYADKDGIIQRGGQDDWKGKNISEAIGKGIGEKIVTTHHGELSGEGLNIGGEWAKNLYDKQIPNILKKLTGQDVEMIKLGLGENVLGVTKYGEKPVMAGQLQPAIRLTPELKAQIKSGKGKIVELFNVGMLGPIAATGIGLAAALKATAARGETGESLDPKYKQQIANAENYGKTTGDWAQVEDIVIRDLKRIGKLKQNVTLEQVKKDPQLYDKVVKLYWDRLDAFGIPEKDKALWWLMPGRYRQTGGDISRLKNPEHRNIMQNRVKNIRGGK